jgi:chromosome partitioning protein
MIIVSGGIKGGSGKTTIATNLAVIRANEDKDVLLVDGDDQETATDFTDIRESTRGEAGYTGIILIGNALREQTKKLKGKYDDIIIDVGGRDTTGQRAALTVADVFLVPFVPRSFDIWTIEAVSNLVAEIREVNPRLRAYTFINRADPRGQDNEEAAAALKKSEHLSFIDAPIVNRKAFGNAASAGLSVVELKPEDPKATEEMTALYKLAFGGEKK